MNLGNPKRPTTYKYFSIVCYNLDATEEKADNGIWKQDYQHHHRALDYQYESSGMALLL